MENVVSVKNHWANKDYNCDFTSKLISEFGVKKHWIWYWLRTKLSYSDARIWDGVIRTGGMILKGQNYCRIVCRNKKRLYSYKVREDVYILWKKYLGIF